MEIEKKESKFFKKILGPKQINRQRICISIETKWRIIWKIWEDVDHDKENENGFSTDTFEEYNLRRQNWSSPSRKIEKRRPKYYCHRNFGWKKFIQILKNVKIKVEVIENRNMFRKKTATVMNLSAEKPRRTNRVFSEKEKARASKRMKQYWCKRKHMTIKKVLYS